jgi:hypothetical protein
VVTVAVDPGRGKDFGEAVDELQGPWCMAPN